MLKLDPTTHDLIVDNFQFKEISTVTEDLAQRLKIKMSTFQGEWFLDEDYGIPYFQEIFVKGATKESVDDIFRIATIREPDVESLLSFTSEYDTTTRKYVVTSKVKTTEGDVVTIQTPL